MTLIKTTLLGIALVTFFLQADSCRKNSDQKSPIVKVSPTPAVKPSGNSTPAKTTTLPAPPSQPQGTSIDQGLWGGPSISLRVTADGAEVEFDCAHGVITGRIQTEKDGSFEVGGTFVPEGGPISLPINGVPREKSFSAKYKGQIEGEKMTLDIKVAETGANLTGLSLIRGRPGSLRKCY